jgi:hypothetical protein
MMHLASVFISIFLQQKVLEKRRQHKQEVTGGENHEKESQSK